MRTIIWDILHWAYVASHELMFLISVHQVCDIRKSPRCLGFWCCGSQQWHCLTSWGLTLLWTSCMPLRVAHLIIDTSGITVLCHLLVLAITWRSFWAACETDKMQTQERRGWLSQNNWEPVLGGDLYYIFLLYFVPVRLDSCLPGNPWEREALKILHWATPSFSLQA
jgi:hypothetical protein